MGIEIEMQIQNMYFMLIYQFICMGYFQDPLTTIFNQYIIPLMQKADIFGKKRLADFYLDPDYINTNHGSYGSCPRVVMAAKRKLQQQMDFNAERWFRFDSQVLLNKTRQLVANKLHCKTQNLFIVQNATDAFNCLAKSLQAIRQLYQTQHMHQSEKQLNGYGTDMASKYQMQLLLLMQIDFTIDDLQSMQKVLVRVEDTINAYPEKISLAVMDHIVSVPGIVMPIDDLCEFFKEKRIPFFIDGAHAMCQVEINLKDLDPDAYFSNFHKWAYAPKNAAFLYISDKYLNIVRPAITGNFRGQGPDRQFFWIGTRDFTSYLVIDKGLQYFDSFGLNRVSEYNRALSIEGANKMAEIWKTKKLTEDTRMMCYMNNVEVPSTDINLCVQIAKKMLDEYNCYPIFYQFHGKVFCRISAQIFNQLSDYVFTATTFLNMLKQETEKQKI